MHPGWSSVAARLAKERAHIDLWLKDLASSDGPRKWYGHDPEKFAEFRRRYEAELKGETGRAALDQVRNLAEQGRVTLVYAARDSEHANAAVLQRLLA